MLTNKHMKKAELVVEDILSIALSVVVLILLLNLFGGNLQKLVQNSNIGRMLYKNNADTKTAYKKMDTDPTKTQANIQIVADQAQYLTEMHQGAAAGINNLIRDQKENGGAPLDDDQLTNLALQATIYAVSGTNAYGLEQLHQGSNNEGQNYLDFTMSQNHINFLFSGGTGKGKYTTSVPFSNGRTRIFDWGAHNDYAGLRDTDTDSNGKIANINGIKKAFY